MIPEIGHFALILALAVAVVQGVVPLIGAQRNDAAWMAAGRAAAYPQRRPMRWKHLPNRPNRPRLYVRNTNNSLDFV